MNSPLRFFFPWKRSKRLILKQLDYSVISVTQISLTGKDEAPCCSLIFSSSIITATFTFISLSAKFFWGLSSIKTIKTYHTCNHLEGQWNGKLFSATLWWLPIKTVVCTHSDFIKMNDLIQHLNTWSRNTILTIIFQAADGINKLMLP